MQQSLNNLDALINRLFVIDSVNNGFDILVHERHFHFHTPTGKINTTANHHVLRFFLFEGWTGLE